MFEIKIKNLGKKYRKIFVFKDVSTIFQKGQLIFLVGKNGSGKSTFIKCILNLVNYQGFVECLGIKYSYCPEKLMLPDYLTLFDFLFLMGKVKDINEEILYKKIYSFIHKFKLEEHENKHLISLSKGTKQKLLIVLTLLVEADVYIFDEPLNGLDCDARRVFYEELRRLHQASKIIIISTHHLSSYRFSTRSIINFDNL